MAGKWTIESLAFQLSSYVKRWQRKYNYLMIGTEKIEEQGKSFFQIMKVFFVCWLSVIAKLFMLKIKWLLN